MKKDNPYFSHDYSASADPKILLMRHDLGAEGYGAYWYLVEQLAQAGGVLPLKLVPVYADSIKISSAKMLTLINNYELFIIENESFYSERLIEHLELRKALSDAGKAGAKKRWSKKLPNPETPINIESDSHPIAPLIAIKEKEIKEKGKIECAHANFGLSKSPPKEQVQMFFVQSGGTKDMAEKFYNKYSATNWTMNGSKITNYTTLALNFIDNWRKSDKSNGVANKVTSVKTWKSNG